jgi:sigma-E factor negative regulatory protein RseC
MDNPRGRVLSLTQNGDDRRAVVVVAEMPVCPRCAAGKGCGAGLFASARGPQEIEALIAPGLQPGIDEEVELQMSPDNLLLASFLVYGLPLIGAIAGAAIAYGLSLDDPTAALLAICGLGSGLLISRWRVKASACMQRFTPKIERRC